MNRVFRLPDLGEGITEAQIVKVLVNKGEQIAEDQGLFEVETDKAAVEIPSPYAGCAIDVHVSAGQTVNVGDVMITFDGNGAAESAPPASEKKPEKPAARSPAPQPFAPQTPPRKTSASAAPAVRKFARELGVNIDTIAGSGPGGRVTKADVESAAAGATPPTSTGQPVAAPVPAPGVADADKWGSTRRAPMTQIRKTIAKQMVKSVTTIPHVTHMDQADVTDLEVMRRQYKDATGGKKRVTVMAVLIKAVCSALKNHPVFNSSLDPDAGEIIYKDYINVGIAVDTERGLVVPNVRNADSMSVSAIAAALSLIAENARTSRFVIEDLRGGTFTITNVGALGGMFSTPVINHPESAILGIGRARQMPAVRDGEIVVRNIMPLSLSFDHRIADGAQAARFCGEIIGYLENPVTLLF